jgi:hypothetical protein
MGTGVTVITSTVRDEAKKWVHLADKMTPVAAKVNDLFLGVTAFWVGEPEMVDAIILQSSYDDYQKFMTAALKAAVVEFGQIAGALNKIANAYDAQDQVVELDLNQIYGARTGP